MASKKDKNPAQKGPPVIENRQARYNYAIEETYEAGIVLQGTEVKSLRQGQATLTDAYAVPKNGELFLLNLHIKPYENGGAFNHDETRTRKLLLKASEINKLTAKIREKRLTFVPLKMYFNDRGKVKVLLGLGKGKKLVDKRESEKKAQADRDMARALRDAGQ
ncbi:MAG: SsrA-binding protein SmpB [Leptospirales bacterium]|jgi:SsrA-binding protein